MSGEGTTSSRGRGRPRSDDVRQAIVSSTISLLQEGGYGALSIEGVAARAGVSKRTIYRWWSSKGALIADAYVESTHQHHPDPDTGNVQSDIEILLTRMCTSMKDPAAANALRSMMIEAQSDPDFRNEFEKFIASRREVLRNIFRRGVERGELKKNLDLECSVDAIFGPFWYRLLSAHAPLDKKFVTKTVGQLMDGVRSN